MLKEKNKTEDNLKKNEFTINDSGAEKAGVFIDHIAEKQHSFIEKNHSEIYKELAGFSVAGNKTKKNIREKYNKTDLMSRLDKIKKNSWGERFRKMAIVFVVFVFFMIFFKMIRPPFILVSLIFSFFGVLAFEVKQDFETIFTKREDYSDPISKALINQFNNTTLNKEEINNLKLFLTEEEFIAAFGHNVNEISLKYGDEALRTVLNKVRYKYELKNKEDHLKKIYYAK